MLRAKAAVQRIHPRACSLACGNSSSRNVAPPVWNLQRRALFVHSQEELFASWTTTREVQQQQHVRRQSTLSHHSSHSPASSAAWQQQQQQQRTKSTAVAETVETEEDLDLSSEAPTPNNNNTTTKSSIPSSAPSPQEYRRLLHIRNVGVFAHVDAGKTTVTERMLALAGIVSRAGNVDDGNTVTDYLPAERERGITIQSAAISFPWAFHNAQAGDLHNDSVQIALIDTPGHVDFSVEVNRSVAVLDGAVLVVDSAAGVQAQTQTVWRALTRPTLNNHESSSQRKEHRQQDHAHEPLPCVAVINKMDKVGANFHGAVASLRHKLPGGSNPICIQLPIFRQATTTSSSTSTTGMEGGAVTSLENLVVAENAQTVHSDEFVGVVDLVHMRAVLWPDACTNRNRAASDVSMVENCLPTVIPLSEANGETCPVTQAAFAGRFELLEALAEIDESIEEMYLNEQEPTNADLRLALRRTTLQHLCLPVLASAAVQGKGIEPCLDAIADFLPSPLDRLPPALTNLQSVLEFERPTNRRQERKQQEEQKRLYGCTASSSANLPPTLCPRGNHLGHCFHPSLLALAFKVVHMKGRGGSGDGRVVFCRIYSGQLKSRDTVQVITPPALGESAQKPRTERVGGMLEMAGGRFDNLENGMALSGEVCALVGLKSVVTGDTIYIRSDSKKKTKDKHATVNPSFCAGVASPRPVLTVKLETETTTEQNKLSHALNLLSIEDPSLIVEDNEATTLLSGLGELHIEIALDRLRREHGLHVMAGPPAVKYRETVLNSLDTQELVRFERTIGDNRLQASIHLQIHPTHQGDDACMILEDPTVTLSKEVLEYLCLLEEEDLEDYDENDLLLQESLELKSPALKSLLQGCRGALKRGPGGYAMANVKCHVVAIDCDAGLSGLQSMPGSLQAAASHAVVTVLQDNLSSCSGMEPKMSMELTVANDDVGTVLSDFSGRRGTVADVLLGDGNPAVGSGAGHQTALVRGEIPLVEILGYANTLRSLTGGESSFTSEYKGHSLCTLK